MNVHFRQFWYGNAAERRIKTKAVATADGIGETQRSQKLIDSSRSSKWSCAKHA